MKFFAVHPSALMYSKVFLRLEPLGLEFVAACNSVYDPKLLLADHAQPVHYAMEPPPRSGPIRDRRNFYLHQTRGRADRAIDDHTERFVDETRAAPAD